MDFRILIPDKISEQGLEILEHETAVILDDIDNHIGNVDAIIVRSRTRLDRELISRGKPRLKVIGRAGVGLDNIDLDAAREHGVVVVNTPESTTVAVAEYTLGLILALARNIPQGNVSMKRGEWEKSSLLGSTLREKILGIIGVGRIGSTLAGLVQGLNMTVLGTDAHKSDSYLRSHDVEPVGLDVLLKRSDFVSIHVPLDENTRRLIDRDSLSIMKPDSYLISTARGGIVDEEALLSALERGHLRGAALDVFEEEPPGLTELIRHPNVIVSPHIAAQAREAQRQTGVDVAHEVLAVLRNKPTRWEIH